MSLRRLLPLAALATLSACDVTEDSPDPLSPYSLTATVLLPDGRPAAHVPVRVERSERTAPDEPTAKESHSGRTDAQGRISAVVEGPFLSLVRIYVHVRPTATAPEQTFGPLTGWTCTKGRTRLPGNACTLDTVLRLTP